MLLMCPHLLEPGDIFLREQGRITAIDREDHPIFDPLVHGLAAHTKEFAHLGHGQQLPRPLFFIEAQHRSMDQASQFCPLPFGRQAKSLHSERIAVEAASHKACRGAYIPFKGIRIPFYVMGDGCEVLAEHGLAQLLSGRLCQMRLAGRLAVMDEFLHPVMHVFQDRVYDLLMDRCHSFSPRHHLLSIRTRQLTGAMWLWAASPKTRRSSVGTGSLSA